MIKFAIAILKILGFRISDCSLLEEKKSNSRVRGRFRAKFAESSNVIE